MSDDPRSQFEAAVNMTSKELSAWLGTNESREAGQHKNGGESTGHASGRRIIVILNKKDRFLDEDREAILAKLRERLSGIVPPKDVVAVAAKAETSHMRERCERAIAALHEEVARAENPSAFPARPVSPSWGRNSMNK